MHVILPGLLSVKKFVHLTILLLIVKSSPVYSLINHIIHSVFLFSDIFKHPKYITICDISYISCILIYILNLYLVTSAKMYIDLSKHLKIVEINLFKK
jgi:hypothetical protein